MAFRLVRPRPQEVPQCPVVESLSKIRTAAQDRHLPSNQGMPVNLQVESRVLASEFALQMVEKGFAAITKEAVDSAAWKSGKWPEGKPTGIIQDDETVFSLGLGRGRSNFFVFMKKNGNYIEIYYSDPRSDEVALAFTPEDVYLKHHVLSTDLDYQNRIAEIVDGILDTAKGKFPEDMRMQTHFHAGRMFDESMKVTDDGASNLSNLLRKAMLYHLDIFNYTPHNSTQYSIHCVLDAVCKAMGITYLPGLELTGSITEEDKNGPHIVLMFDGYGRGSTANVVRDEILRGHTELEMVSYLQGIAFEEVQKVLQRLRAENRLVMLYAHPMNNASELPGRPGQIKIASVGLWSSVEEGRYTMDEALALAKLSDGSAAWNATLPDAGILFKNTDLLQFLWPLVKRFKCGNTLTANACNMATAKWMESIGLNSHYESDEHDTTPMSRTVAGGSTYGTGNDGFAKGFTRVKLPKEFFKRLLTERRNITAKELVEMISKKQIELRAKVFAEVQDGFITMAKARTESPHFVKMERAWLKLRQGWNYFVALVKDLAHFIKHGEWSHVFHMDA